MLELKLEAEHELVSEARKHRISRVLVTAPGLGPIRVAQLLPIVVTPHRFRTRSQFWAYCGLGIVMRSSSDWVQTGGGPWALALTSWVGRSMGAGHAREVLTDRVGGA